MDVERCYFHYSFTDNANCGGCSDKITVGALRVKCDGGLSNGGISHYYSLSFYHFDCFFKSEECFKKDEIMVEVYIRDGIESNDLHDNEDIKKMKVFGERLYASLETLEKNLPFIELAVRPVDCERIRRKFASAPEGHVCINKIPYFETCLYCSIDFPSDGDVRRKDDFCLMFTHKYFHPKCLAESGVVNIDAKERDPVFMVVNKYIYEECNYCKNIASQIKEKELRIRYKIYSYHPSCFAEMYEVNIDGKNIPGYDQMEDDEKEILDKYFIKSHDFDIPIIEKAAKDDYCNAVDCCMAQTASTFRYTFDNAKYQNTVRECRISYHPACFKNSTQTMKNNDFEEATNDDYCISPTPSKFPYAYTIAKDQPQIRYINKIYHPICLKISVKSDIAAKEMKNYDSLTDEEKQDFDELFKMKPPKRNHGEDEEEPSTKRMQLLDEEKENVETEATNFKDPEFAENNTEEEDQNDEEKVQTV
uniref:PARP-type domain-containing protein n=1 Tax=Panagrolaimus sp. ES5 TaxID=591445 RepID=A0AC34FGR1_9BILA